MSEKMYNEWRLKIAGSAFALLIGVVAFFLVRTFGTIDNTSEKLDNLTISFEIFKIRDSMKVEKIKAMDVTLQSTNDKVEQIKSDISDQRTKLDKLLKSNN